MRVRFSLRILLIVFTIVAILFGGAAQVYYRTIGRVRQQQARIDKLTEMGFRVRLAWQSEQMNDAPFPFLLQALNAEWVKGETFPQVSEFWQGDLSEPITCSQAEAALAVLKDVRGVPGVRLHVDRVTPKLVSLIAPHSDCTALDLQFTRMDAVAPLGNLQQLHSLTLDGPLTNETLKEVGRLTSLEYLTLEATGVSESALAELGKLSNLRHLTIRGEIQGAEPFQSLRSNQEYFGLHLSRVSMDEAAQQAFAKLPKVSSIEISGDCRVRPDFWPLVAGLPGLSEVTIEDLPETEIAGVTALANCKTLYSLDMEMNALAAADIQQFEGHPTLKELTFCGDLSQTEIERFLTATPKCELTVVKPQEEGSTARSGRTYYMTDSMGVQSTSWPQFVCGGVVTTFTP